jgi:protein-tyrosine phosphatase
MHLLKCNNITFYVFPCPNNNNAIEISQELLKSDVKTIVHLVNIDYDISSYNNISFIDFIFEDGGIPDKQQLKKWYTLIDNFNYNKMNIGIHCKASLGRAPLMIVIALIYYGMDFLDAIQYVRTIIKGAINTRQINYLELNYKNIKKSNKDCSKCIIC